jgi:hypothetical protein
MRLYPLFFLPFLIFADTGVDSDLADDKGPWFTGPLLTGSAYTIPKGHFNIESYVYIINDLGYFGSRGHIHYTPSKELPKAINNAYVCQLGLTEWIDINIIPQFTANYGGVGKDSIGMGDLIIGPSFQLLREDKRFGGLTFKIGLNQVFPCGRFENLNPVYSGNDGIGNGCWSTKLYCIGSKLFDLGRNHYLGARGAFSSILFIPTKVTGRNIYGGDETTSGRIARGASVIVDLGFELSITKNIVLALDIENLWMTAASFKGTTILPVGNQQDTYMLSFAPALEYNWNKNVGIIAGVWLSAYGLNVEGFINGVVALNIYI